MKVMKLHHDTLQPCSWADNRPKWLIAGNDAQLQDLPHAQRHSVNSV